jgi:predicted nucleic acid-binding protein
MKQEEDGISYFWDSYAIIELENGNTKYLKYSEYPVILTIFNLIEVYWVILNQIGEKEANKVYEEYRSAVVDVEDEILKEAIKFRKKVYKNKKISYIDAIGYIYSLKNNLIFLTGDKEFEDLENVEFVKK